MGEEEESSSVEGKGASKGEKSEEEDAVEIAKTMLIEGVEVEKVAEDTGLPKRRIWSLKGNLVKAGKIPSKKELEIKEMAGVGTRGEEVPFRRGKSAPELIVEISKKYGVKDRATRIIADRCQRVPGGILHPSDFERLLMDLDSGLQRREAMLITEEYDLALQREKTEDESARRGYYPDRSSSREGRPYRYGETEDYGRPSRYEPGYEPSYDRYGRPATPEYGGRGEVSGRDLERLETRLLETIRREKEEDRMDKILDSMKNQSEDIATLATELKNLKENPPSTPQPSMEDNPYLKALELQLNISRDEAKATREETKEQAKEFRELIRDERKEHREILEKREREIKEAESRGRSGEGYRSDELRLASEGLHRVADVLEKKEPVKVVIEGAKKLVEKEEEKPPERKKLGETEVTLPTEYLE